LEFSQVHLRKPHLPGVMSPGRCGFRWAVVQEGARVLQRLAMPCENSRDTHLNGSGCGHWPAAQTCGGRRRAAGRRCTTVPMNELCRR
jgi:hypothetical protein